MKTIYSAMVVFLFAIGAVAAASVFAFSYPTAEKDSFLLLPLIALALD